MSKGRDRTVFRREDRNWVNKRNDANKPSSIHPTQQGAAVAAKEMLQKQGGGELSIKGLDGKIRSKDTIAPGNDPRSIKDHEH